MRGVPYEPGEGAVLPAAEGFVMGQDKKDAGPGLNVFMSRLDQGTGL
jgi:hypothetical protein